VCAAIASSILFQRGAPIDGGTALAEIFFHDFDFVVRPSVGPCQFGLCPLECLTASIFLNLLKAALSQIDYGFAPQVLWRYQGMCKFAIFHLF